MDQIEGAPHAHSTLRLIRIHIEFVGSQGSDLLDVLLIQLSDEIDMLRKTRQAVYRTCHRSDRKIPYSQIVQNMK